MRCIPGITIVDITDGTMLKSIVMDVSEPDRLMYIRMPRGMKLKRVYGSGTKFEYGKAMQLKEGSDITIVAAGLMVARALEAAERLEENGVSVEVIRCLYHQAFRRRSRLLQRGKDRGAPLLRKPSCYRRPLFCGGGSNSAKWSPMRLRDCCCWGPIWGSWPGRLFVKGIWP